MQIINSTKDLDYFVQNNHDINFVPTMGNLHEGHLSLVHEANAFSGVTLVSIYVNPLQFGPNEDLAIYPRTLDVDLEKLKANSCDAVFHPDTNFAKDTKKLLANPLLAKKLCGISRPHFFDGVVSILNHFFELIHPKNTFFGLKDYQQFLIVKDFLNQSNLDIAIHGVDIVRERDGLAMSSRNNLLTPNQRLIAKNLSLILNDIYVNIGKHSLSNLRDQNIKKLTNLGFDVDYLSFCDSTSLEEISEIKPNTLVAIAAKLETVRLIDNILIK